MRVVEDGSSDKDSKYVPVNKTKNCILLGIAQRVVVIPYSRFGTISLCPIFKGHGFLALEDGIDSLSRNVGKYYWPSNCPEQRSSHLLGSGSLKTRIG